MRVSPVDPYLVHSLIGIGYAFIELGRFDEAVVAGKKALRQTPALTRLS
jgi:adenylate cyclase